MSSKKQQQPAAADPMVDDEKDEGQPAPSEVADEAANDAATGLTSTDDNAASSPQPVGELTRYGFDLLANIKQAQLQNGLRHGDYQRYRQYCARRLRRLRVGLKFTNHKREFKAKSIEATEANDVRYLALPLVSAERCWGYAMQLKNDLTQETQRKKFHLRKRLAKAATWATTLVDLCAVRADTRTQLQAEAYAAWMHGSLLFEKSQHERALAKFLLAKTVYEKLGSIGGSAMQILCEERVASLADMIRYCKWKLHQGTDADEDVEMLEGGHDDLLVAKLEELRQERMINAAKTLDTIDWQGKTVPVSNEKLRVAFVTAKIQREQLEKALASTSSSAAASSESKAEDGAPESQNLSLLYQKLFGAYDEALKILRDALLEPKMLEAHKAHLLALKEYATSQRLEVQIIRNQQFIAAVSAQLKAQEQTPDAFRAKKKVKSDEVVNLYEKLLAALQELQEIAQANKNAAEVKTFAVRIAGAQAARTFYLAESYRRLKKYTEAYALYGRALELMDEFTKTAGKAGQDASVFATETTNVTALKKEAVGARNLAHAHALLEEAEKQAAASKKTEPTGRTLLERLDEWDTGDAAAQFNLLEFPAPALMSTKPAKKEIKKPEPKKPEPKKPVVETKKPEPTKVEAKKPEPTKKEEPKKPQAKKEEPKEEVKKPVAATPTPAPAAAAAKKATPAPAKPVTPEPEPEAEPTEAEEEEESEEEVDPDEQSTEDEGEKERAPAAAAAKKAPQAPATRKPAAPPGEKASVKRERERREREAEEARRAKEEAAKQAQGWGFGGLLGKAVSKVWGK